MRAAGGDGSNRVRDGNSIGSEKLREAQKRCRAHQENVDGVDIDDWEW